MSTTEGLLTLLGGVCFFFTVLGVRGVLSLRRKRMAHTVRHFDASRAALRRASGESNKP